MKIPSPNLFCSLQGSPCGPTMQGSAPCTAVPFFSKRKEPKIRQRGGILFGFSSKGHIPSGTSQSEVLSPYLLRQQKDVKYWRTTSDSRVPLSSALSADAKGFQKGRSPFRWKSKNQEVFGASFVDFFATRNRPRVWAA